MVTRSFAIRLVLACTLASTVAAGMVAWRVLATGSSHYTWLVFPNLPLAWIPLVLSFVIHRVWTIQRRISVLMLVLGAVWLLFLPNAPYIVTDLVYLSLFKDGISVYYDVVMTAFTAFVALIMGYVSLYLVHRFVAEWLRPWTGWAFALIILLLCGVGVYLGRFLRWNSWDALYRLDRIVADIWAIPGEPEAVMFVGAFSLALMSAYLIIYACIRRSTES